MTRYKAIKQVLNEQNKISKVVQFILASVDPDRDTADRLKEYLAYFDTSFIGISGRLGALDTLTAELFTTYTIPEHPINAFYTVTHSSAIYLIDPKGRVISILTLPHDNKDITQRYLTIKTFIEKNY